MTSDRNRTVEDHHECSRLAKGTEIAEDGRVDGIAFRLRESDKFLSVSCIDFHDGETREDRIDQLRAIFLSNMNIRTHHFAIFGVGEAVSYVRESTEDARELTIDHRWEEDDHSHCGVHGFDYGEDIIADLLAETVSPDNVVKVKLSSKKP